MTKPSRKNSTARTATGRPIPKTAGWLVAALLATACGPGDGGDADQSAALAEWDLTLVASIGAGALSDEAGPEEFGRVSGVALGPDGEVFVADRLNFEVRVFGLDGSHRRSFGRRGQGPGEFESLYSIAWVGDRLLALDYGNMRISEFSAAGDHLGQRETASGISGSGLRLYSVGATEAYVDDFDVEDDWRHVYAGHGPAGPTGVAIPVLPQPESLSSQIVCDRGEVLAFYQIPFAPRLIQHPGPGGLLYSATTDTYRIVATQGADTVRVIEGQADAAPVTDAEWEKRTEAIRSLKAENPGIACEPDLPGKPSAKPVLKALFVAPDGRVWIEVAAAGGDRWDVFDPDGRPLARVQAPARIGVPAFGAEHVVTIRRDSLDLDYVDVYRITRPDGR